MCRGGGAEFFLLSAYRRQRTEPKRQLFCEDEMEFVYFWTDPSVKTYSNQRLAKAKNSFNHCPKIRLRVIYLQENFKSFGKKFLKLHIVMVESKHFKLLYKCYHIQCTCIAIVIKKLSDNFNDLVAILFNSQNPDVNRPRQVTTLRKTTPFSISACAGLTLITQKKTRGQASLLTETGW